MLRGQLGRIVPASRLRLWRRICLGDVELDRSERRGNLRFTGLEIGHGRHYRRHGRAGATLALPV